MTPWQIEHEAKREQWRQERVAEREQMLAHPEMVRAFAEIEAHGLTPCRIGSSISRYGVVVAMSEEREGSEWQRAAILTVTVFLGRMTVTGAN